MTESAGAAPVVVGVDGSSAADAAVDWAASEAMSQGRPLRIVHGFVWPLVRPAVPLGPAPGDPPDRGLRPAAERILEEARARALGVAPAVEVTTRLVVGGAAPAVLEEARDAALVVVGNRGLGGFLGLLVGSVSVAVAAHAPCPVMVVRAASTDEHPVTTGRILVGVDGSEMSAMAVEYAFERAARHGSTVVAVHAWALPVSGDAGADFAAYVYIDEFEQAGREILDEALAPARKRLPDVKVETKLVRDHPGHALQAESQDADLVVVGSRGRGGFRGLLLGSVSQAMLHHAACSVAVVRPHT